VEFDIKKEQCTIASWGFLYSATTLERLQWVFLSQFHTLNASIGPGSIHCVPESMNKLVLCMESAPIFFSLGGASEVRPSEGRGSIDGNECVWGGEQL
jgi:hypothetical protein